MEEKINSTKNNFNLREKLQPLSAQDPINNFNNPPSNLHTKHTHIAKPKPKPKETFSEKIDYKRAIFNLINSAVPCLLSLMFLFLYDNLNIIFANKFLSRDSVSAIGVGSLYINATSFFLGLGLIGGVDTLCSQAYGAKSFYLMGLYVNISRIVLIGFFIFVSLPFILTSEHLLLLIGQPPEIILLTSFYIKSMIPSVFFALQFYISNHYLQAMNMFYPGMIITLITAVLHTLWLTLFVGVFELGTKGVGYSMGVTHLLNFCIITLYIENKKPNPQSYFCFDINSTSLERVFDYLKLAVPSAIMFTADWLGFHIVILYSSYIDLTSLAANVSLFNFFTLLFAIPNGISFAACVLIGNSIGRNKVNTAKFYALFSCLSACFVIFLITFILQNFKDAFPFIYTSDPAVAKIFTRVLHFVILFSLFESLQIILNGILKGLGKQKPASILAFIIFYPINIPMSLTLAFSLNYGSIGLWYSQLTAVIFLSFAYSLMILCLDWENHSQRTIVKIKNVAEKMIKKSKKLELDHKNQ